VKMLARMKAAARRMVLVSDLRRSLFGLALAFGAGHLLTRSAVVHNDAGQSVRAAFTMRELAAVAGSAGLTGATIEPRWPARMLLHWQATG
jgi:hypothetical protein